MTNFYYARMSICNQIVISLGGMFGFELSPKGPKFGFLIPLDHMNSNLSAVVEDQIVFDSRKSAPAPAVVKAANTGDVKEDLYALVVDDIKTNRQLLSRLVGNRGVKVDMVEDGKKALEYMKENMNKINIIFMDNMMPVMTGIESTSCIRNEGFGGLIVGVTGNTLGEEVMLFMDAGADFILGKPVNVAQLDAIINHSRTHGKYSPRSKIHDSKNNEELKELFIKLEIEVKRLSK